jgi:hypothetical protein
MDGPGQVRSTSRLRTFARIFSVLTLTVFSVGLALSTLVFLWVPYEETGAVFTGDTVTQVAAGSPAAKAGLRIGDRFDPKTSFFDRMQAGWPTHRAQGERVTFRILRDGSYRTVTMRFTTAHASPWSAEDTALYIAGLSAFLTFVIVGTLLVLLRPTPLTWMFFIFCVGNPVSRNFGTVDVLLSIPAPFGFVLNMLRTTLLIVGYIAFLDFALRFPKIRAVGWRAGVEHALPILLALFLVNDYYLWISQFYVSPTNYVGKAVSYVGTAVMIASCIIATASLVGTYRGSSPQNRHRLSWVVAGTLAGYTIILVRDFLLGYLPPGYDFTDSASFTLAYYGLSAFAPLALGYGILRHRVIDVRFVINRAAVYASVIAILVIVFESSSWLIERLLQQTRTVEILQLIIAIGLAISIQHSFKHVETIVNRWFFKSVHDAQEHLSRVASALLSAESAGAVERLLASEPVSALKLTTGALFRRHAGGRFERTAAVGWSNEDNRHFDSDDPLVLYLQGKRGSLSLTDAPFSDSYVLSKTKCADEAVSIFSQGELTAIALYGPHANGTKLDPGERSTLTNLAVAAEQAYESLQTRLENARRLSELLERVHGTVDYDEIHYYLADQLLQMVPERTRTALVACAVIPQATAEDIIHATGDEENVERLEHLMSGSAVVRVRADGTYTLHPLIRHVLFENAGVARQDMLLRCARAWQERHQDARAAQLYREAEMRRDATEASNGQLRKTAPARKSSV